MLTSNGESASRRATDVTLQLRSREYVKRTSLGYQQPARGNGWISFLLHADHIGSANPLALFD
jgi:hypothetical protein